MVSVGRIAASISSPDRHALLVLNEKLKGRINSNLRDDKATRTGFTTRSTFAMTWAHSCSQAPCRQSRPHNGGRDFQGDERTRRREADHRGGTDHDPEGMVPEWINRFETIADVAAEVAFLVSHQLPDDHFAHETGRFDAVTRSRRRLVGTALPRTAVDDDLVVGDRSRIEKSLGLFRSARSFDSRQRGKPVARQCSIRGLETVRKASSPWAPTERLGPSSHSRTVGRLRHVPTRERRTS